MDTVLNLCARHFCCPSIYSSIFTSLVPISCRFVVAFLCSCSAVQDILRSEKKNRFLPCSVVGPSYSQVQPGFLVLPFRRGIHVIKSPLNVKFYKSYKIYRFNSSLCLTSPSCIFWFCSPLARKAK